MDTRQRLSDLAVSDRGFVFDPYTGITYSLNESGQRMLDGLKRGLPRKAIVDELREGFEIGDDEDPDRDLAEFVLQLKRQNLIPADFEL